MFPSAISRYLVPNSSQSSMRRNTKWFPSAISRYLVPNFATGSRFHATTEGFPSAISRYLVPNYGYRLEGIPLDPRFHPLYRGTWFPTGTRFDLVHSNPREFPSAISRYLVPNYSRDGDLAGDELLFPSAISRYLVPNLAMRITIHRWPWVSIRYIAVLGSQPYQKNTPSDQRRRKRFTHPPSNRSHSHICFLKLR